MLEQNSTDNAKVTHINIGTMFHDGRCFASISFDGGGWSQGANFKADGPTIDGIIAACGASDLFDCVGKYCQVKREDGFIAEVGHILGGKSVRLR